LSSRRRQYDRERLLTEAARGAPTRSRRSAPEGGSCARAERPQAIRLLTRAHERRALRRVRVRQLNLSPGPRALWRWLGSLLPLT
jgi:hypothetical protein